MRVLFFNFLFKKFNKLTNYLKIFEIFGFKGTKLKSTDQWIFVLFINLNFCEYLNHIITTLGLNHTEHWDKETKNNMKQTGRQIQRNRLKKNKRKEEKGSERERDITWMGVCVGVGVGVWCVYVGVWVGVWVGGWVG